MPKNQLVSKVPTDVFETTPYCDMSLAVDVFVSVGCPQVSTSLIIPHEFHFFGQEVIYGTLSAFVLRSLGISAESDSLNTCGLEVTALAAFYAIEYETTILTNRSLCRKKEINMITQ